MNTDKKNIFLLTLKTTLVIVFISSLFFSACNADNEKFTLGTEFIESQTELNLIDTFSVSFSTVIFDSILTNGTGNILIGNYENNVFGKITCNSYFQIGVPYTIDGLDNDTYDSLKLFIIYNN